MLTAAKAGGQPRSVDGRGAELTFRGLAFGIIEILSAFGVFIKVIVGFLTARAKACVKQIARLYDCLLYTSPSPRDQRGSRMPSSA